MSESNLSGTKNKETVRELLNKHYDSKVVGPMNERIDTIESYCKEQIKKLQDQNKAVISFIVQEVKVEIANKLHNADITMSAWEKVLMAEGLKIENLAEKIDAAKKEINAERVVAAEAKIKEQALGENKEAQTQ